MEGTAAPATSAAPATQGGAPSSTNGSTQAATSTPAPVKLPAEGSAKTQPAATEAAGKTGEAAIPAAAKPVEDFFEVPVDGKKVRMSREEVLRRASLADAANSRFEQAAKMRKEAEDKLGKIKTPRDAMKFLTDPKNQYDPKEVREAFEEWYDNAFIKPESMTPEQRRIAELEQYKKDKEEQDAERTRQETEAKNAKEDEYMLNQLQNEIKECLDVCGLPKTKFTAGRIAYWMRQNEASGINAPKELIIQQVQKETSDICKGLVQMCNGDAGQIIKVLGEDVVKIIRAHDIAQIRARRNGGASQVEPTGGNPPAERPSERISEQEVKRRARKLFA